MSRAGQENASRFDENLEVSGARQHITKRGHDASRKDVGMKKGRSVLEDVTNDENAAPLEPVGRAKQKGPRPALRDITQDSAPDDDFVVLDDAEDMDTDSHSHSSAALITRQLWKDIDKADWTSLSCSSFAQDIMNNLFKAERLRRPIADYMAGVQHDITAHMRAILVDWLVEVAQEYKLVTETLYLTVDYVDRYLAAVPTQRNHLQLVGVTCMLLASKYEEIYPPSVEEFCFITENTYTREQLLATERRALDALGFELAVPSTRVFVRRCIKAAAASLPADPDHRLDLLSNYLTELTLLEYDSLAFLPSMVAASAVLVAQYCLRGCGWNATLQHYSGYSAAHLSKCARFVHRCFLGAKTSELPSIREKYSLPQYGCIAELLPPPTLPARLFGAF